MKNPFANLFKKKDASAPPKVGESEKKKKGKFFERFLKNRLGKSAVQGEEIVGVELTPSEIRMAQLSSNKSNQWVLDKFFVHKIELGENATILDNPDKVGDELKVALQKSKITTTNAAMLFP